MVSSTDNTLRPFLSALNLASLSTCVRAALVVVLRIWLHLWDAISYPAYVAIQKPWNRMAVSNKVKTQIVSVKHGEFIYEAIPPTSLAADYDDEAVHPDFAGVQCTTVADSWRWALNRYRSRALLGTRTVVDETTELVNGKQMRKQVLGTYTWNNYREVDQESNRLGYGLLKLGLKSGDKLCLYAETRHEWFVTALACFKFNFTVVTIYTNLGEDAVVYGLNQTKSPFMVTSADLTKRLLKIVKSHDLPHLRHILQIENQKPNPDTAIQKSSVLSPVVWHTYRQVVSLGDLVLLSNAMGHGERQQLNLRLPRPADQAMIMYTSGSTGVPKGVIFSHENLASTLKNFMMYLGTGNRCVTIDDCYIAFLPVAHVLELLSEMVMCMFGIKIGFSSPHTLMDDSTMVKKGCMGDIKILRPTIMASVPLILDRIYKSIRMKVDKISACDNLFPAVFDTLCAYKRRQTLQGFQTPIIDALLFRNIQQVVGGRIRLLLCGGAPLSTMTQNFIRTCLNCDVVQGYGLTETCACATIMPISDGQLSEANVGIPIQNTQIKLVDWAEGGYHVVNDRSTIGGMKIGHSSDDGVHNPRGEIHIGSTSVSADGYYAMADATANNFYTDESGRRWFRTGDIGEVVLDQGGVLKIIDRKKDLVKLQYGEYVSLGKVEACLKSCPIVDNICVYAESTEKHTVALICPDRQALLKLATEAKASSIDVDLDKLCSDETVVSRVVAQIRQHGMQNGLERFEIPTVVTLIPGQSWQPDSGLVTAAFKLRRNSIRDVYMADFDKMYGRSTPVVKAEAKLTLNGNCRKWLAEEAVRPSDELQTTSRVL